MVCPSCGLADASGAECARCGVVFAKLAATRERLRPPRVPAETTPPPETEPAGLSLSTLATGAAVLGLLLWAGLDRLRVGSAPPPGTTRAPGSTTAQPAVTSPKAGPDAAPAATAEAEPPPPSLLPADPVPGGAPLAADAGVEGDDVRRANALILKGQRGGVEAADLSAAEELRARYPNEERLADVLLTVITALAVQEQQRHRFPEAQALFRRAVQARPGNLTARLNLVVVLNDAGEFAGAEAAAREALLLEPRNADLLYSLGYALFRQDRNREAAEALQASLEAAENAPARTLLERVRKTARDERGMAERQLAHFHVRYDGDAHEDVGREILRQLERHYATLVRSFDHEPLAPIPVILFSGQQYYDATGAPSWSGGQFDQLDGRIRIPIGGLTTSLTPEMDATLIHELAHAFIHDVSRGNAPRELHEGVAQYVEGKRIASRYTPQQLAAIADGRAGGVGGYYASALAFVEYLAATRGTGGVAELLRAIGETGSVDTGFERVYGADFAATQRAWRERIRQQYGS